MKRQLTNSSRQPTAIDPHAGIDDLKFDLNAAIKALKDTIRVTESLPAELRPAVVLGVTASD